MRLKKTGGIIAVFDLDGSGTDRLIVRGIAYDSPLGLPNKKIIGSDEVIAATGQGETNGLDYVFKDSDKLILGGEFIIKNLKMNKVSVK